MLFVILLSYYFTIDGGMSRLLCSSLSSSDADIQENSEGNEL